MSQADRIKWDATYLQRTGPPGEVDAFLRSLEESLPRAGRALDIAGGDGRNALWLARRGLSVTLVDISPVALARAGAAAASEGLDLTALELDLEQQPLPQGPWDLVVIVRYLQRSLFADLPGRLTPGGLLVVSHPTRSNLSRHPRPGERFVLEDGELPGLIGGLDVCAYAEGWTAWGHHEAHLLARRPPAP